MVCFRQAALPDVVPSRPAARARRRRGAGRSGHCLWRDAAATLKSTFKSAARVAMGSHHLRSSMHNPRTDEDFTLKTEINGTGENRENGGPQGSSSPHFQKPPLPPVKMKSSTPAAAARAWNENSRKGAKPQRKRRDGLICDGHRQDHHVVSNGQSQQIHFDCGSAKASVRRS